MTSKSKDANKIGYPLLIKAAAGGGGKGMRIVHKSKDLNEAIKSAQREAKSGFGDERIFIERYLLSLNLPESVLNKKVIHLYVYK